MGDFTPDRLDSRSLYTLWEWKNRVLLEEYYVFNVAIPRASPDLADEGHRVGLRVDFQDLGRVVRDAVHHGVDGT